MQIATIPLCELEVGQTACLVNIAYEETILLEYLVRLGFFPGTMLTVEEIAPYQGPLMIRLQDRTEALGREIASHIFVEVQD